MKLFSRLFKDERAATAVEYGMILAFIFLALIVGVRAFAAGTIGVWTHVANEVEEATPKEK